MDWYFTFALRRVCVVIICVVFGDFALVFGIYEMVFLGDCL